MNNVILYGNLREQYGESFNISCRDPIEAYRALSCQLPGFRDEVRMGEFHLVREMPNGALALTEEMLFLGMDNCKLHFLPAIEGYANKGGAKLILGIAIAGAALFVPGGALVTVGMGSTLAGMGVMAGAALALGGLALLLAPTPRLSTGTDDTKDSVLFSGNSNPSGQNQAVGVGFGLFRVPGIPVATQIVTNEISSGQNSLSNFYAGVTGAGGSFYFPNMAQN